MTTTIRYELSEPRPVADGKSFGDAGPYERVTGRVHLAWDRADVAALPIVDGERAQVGSDGRVHATAEVGVVRPCDPERFSGTLLYDSGNRGNKRALQYFNDAVGSNDPMHPEHFGNGFLMRRGVTMLWLAWQGDVLPGNHRLTLDLPVALDDDGQPLQGLVRTEYVARQPGVRCIPLSGFAVTRSHPTVSMNPADASLTRRRYAGSVRQTIDPSRWRFAAIETGSDDPDSEAATFQGALVASDRHLFVDDAFLPGWIYEIVYRGHSPLVLGLGELVIRDVVADLRRDGGTTGESNSLLAGRTVTRAIMWGRSQTGRLIRDFLHRGFNRAANGTRVFDGVMPHVAGAGVMGFNRFGNLQVPTGLQHEFHDDRADVFPFAYGVSTDHLTGRTSAILSRPDTDPKVIHTHTSTEYWQRHQSLAHTDSRGHDIDLPPNVRMYHWSSSAHVADPLMQQPSQGLNRHPINVVRTSFLFRALFDRMIEWIDGIADPPDSRIPRVADGTLVDMATYAADFPAIPGVVLPRGPSALPLRDYGPSADQGILSKLPPTTSDEAGYPVLVPAVDEDGLEIAGIRVPMVAAPLATTTGWNIRRRGHGHGAMHRLSGATIMLPETAEEAAMTGDRRRPITDRYATDAEYQAALLAAAEQLIAERLMLPEDRQRAGAAAAGWDRSRHDVQLEATE